MKVFVYRKVPFKPMSNATINGHHLRIVEWNHSIIPENSVSADTFDLACNAITDILPEAVPIPVPLRSLTKRELVDRLIERDLATAFSAILDSLPLEEKLRYDASPTISPDYAYIAENMSEICTALDISEEQFKDIFR